LRIEYRVRHKETGEEVEAALHIEEKIPKVAGRKSTPLNRRVGDKIRDTYPVQEWELVACSPIKGQHGGTRPGAGRPPVNPEGATMQCSISIPAVLVAKIDALSEKNNMSRNGVAVALLRKMLSD
jgi:hypothetical protein